jgi:hypothetical protein
MSIRLPHPLLAVAAIAGAAAVVVPAMAQDQSGVRIESSATATPNKAGTAAHPRGMSISAQARLIFPEDVEAPIVTGLEIVASPGLDWHGEKYVACAKATLDRKGPKGCPRASIMGTGTATGRADTVAARVDIVFVNGGLRTNYAYATLNNPARVRETLVLHSTRLSGGPWGHRETVSIPRSLQIVGGVPLQLDRIRFTIGGRSYAKGYVASTSCPGGGWKYQVTAHTSTDGQASQVVGSGSIPCTK